MLSPTRLDSHSSAPIICWSCLHFVQIVGRKCLTGAFVVHFDDDFGVAVHRHAHSHLQKQNFIDSIIYSVFLCFHATGASNTQTPDAIQRNKEPPIHSAIKETGNSISKLSFFYLSPKTLHGAQKRKVSNESGKKIVVSSRREESLRRKCTCGLKVEASLEGIIRDSMMLSRKVCEYNLMTVRKGARCKRCRRRCSIIYQAGIFWGGQIWSNR